LTHWTKVMKNFI